jgi:hypothetical protein
MKKLYFTIASFLIAGTTFGQTIANAGMESWRTGAAGTAPVVPIQAPNQWFGFDSIVVSYGQLFGSIIGAGSDWHQQIFEETTFKNGGVASARVMTETQDVIGAMPGILSNAKIDVDLGILSGGGDPMSAVLYDGGTAVTERPTTVSAWVAYFPGPDTTTGLPGTDEGVLTAQALATVGAVSDSVVGTGTFNIAPSASFTQITANIVYGTTDYAVHTLRIIFASSGGAGSALDSSILYVDDVSYTGVPQSVRNVAGNVEVVRVFPNPASGKLYLSSAKHAGYTFSLVSVSGQAVASQQLTGADQVDISDMAAGLYLYVVTDKNGNTLQRGKVSVF